MREALVPTNFYFQCSGQSFWGCCGLGRVGELFRNARPLGKKTQNNNTAFLLIKALFSSLKTLLWLEEWIISLLHWGFLRVPRWQGTLGYPTGDSRGGAGSRESCAHPDSHPTPGASLTWSPAGKAHSGAQRAAEPRKGTSCGSGFCAKVFMISRD